MRDKLCECGCGEKIVFLRHHKHRNIRYRVGHNRRGSGKGWRINHGYRQCIHRGKNLWKYEHVIIMEKSIGRSISSGEVVHHINHEKLDNRLENLELTTISKHMSYHMKLNNPRKKKAPNI